ncbi:MAG: F0F1 ATP synthase subunit B [Thermacetogeniaceae bacterium]
MSISWPTFAWAIINFLVILAILYYFFYNPVLSFIDSRREEIAHNISDSEYSRAEAQKLLHDYQAQLLASRQEAQQVIDKATKLGEESRQALLAQSRVEATALLENARKEIQRERDDALQSLRQEVVSLSVMAASKILGRTITEEDNAHIVNQFLDEVGEIH